MRKPNPTRCAPWRLFVIADARDQAEAALRRRQSARAAMA